MWWGRVSDSPHATTLCQGCAKPESGLSSDLAQVALLVAWTTLRQGWELLPVGCAQKPEQQDQLSVTSLVKGNNIHRSYNRKTSLVLWKRSCQCGKVSPGLNPGH